MVSFRIDIAKPLQAKYEALAGTVEVHLDGGNDDTWPSIKNLHQQEILFVRCIGCKNNIIRITLK